MRLRRTTRLLAGAAILLGIGHLALTPLLYPGWTIDCLWFVGTGLAMLIGAGANMISIGPDDRVGRTGLVLINLAMTVFFASAWPVLPQPQVIVGGILFAGLAATAALFRNVAHGMAPQNAR